MAIKNLSLTDLSNVVQSGQAVEYTTVMPILVRKIMVVLKANGGLKIKNIEASETNSIKLTKEKTNESPEERVRNNNENVIYRRIEVAFTPVSLPITNNLVLHGSFGGSIESSSYMQEDLHKDWPQIIKFIKDALLLEIKVGQFQNFKNVLGSEYMNIQIPAMGTVEEEFTLSVLQDKAGSDWNYAEYFAQQKNDFELGFAEVPKAHDMERRLGFLSDDGSGPTEDIELEVTFRAIGDIGFPVLNSGQ